MTVSVNDHLAPVVTGLKVIPVAGHDSMPLNLSGAHGPFFTRNLVILTDSGGNTGVGKVPGGDAIRQTIEDAALLGPGESLGARNDAAAMQYLVPGWTFDNKRPCMVR